LLGAALGAVGVEWQARVSEQPFLHPGRAAVVVAGARTIGFLGELHPAVAAAWDLAGVAAWAVDLGAVAALAPEVGRYAPFSTLPAVRADLPRGGGAPRGGLSRAHRGR